MQQDICSGEALKILNSLPTVKREEVLTIALKSLPVDVRSRVVGLKESGLVFVEGKFERLTEDIAVNYRGDHFNFQEVLKALTEWHKRQLL